MYLVGKMLKQTEFIRDKYIPLMLGGMGIVICAVYVLATCTCTSPQSIAMAVFMAVTQGILVAGLSTYIDQIGKQLSKKE